MQSERVFLAVIAWSIAAVVASVAVAVVVGVVRFTLGF